MKKRMIAVAIMTVSLVFGCVGFDMTQYLTGLKEYTQTEIAMGADMTEQCKLYASDFDNDKVPEITVMSMNGTVKILERDAAGSLAIVKTLQVGDGEKRLWSLGILDFNNDGFQDFVAGFSSNGMDIYYGKGNFTFSTQVVSQDLLAMGNPALVCDLDADGKKDEVIFVKSMLDQKSGLHFLVFHSDGNMGTFSTSYKGPIFQAAVGNLNGDSLPDVALGGMGWAGIYLMDKQVENTNVVNLDITNGLVTAMAMGDMNGDGIDDLLFYEKMNSDITILLGGKANLSETASIFYELTVSSKTSYSPFYIDAIDMDGDGTLDLVSACNDKEQASTAILVSLNAGKGLFQVLTSDYKAFIPVGSSHCVVLDIDDDGKKEFLVSGIADGVTKLFLVKAVQNSP